MGRDESATFGLRITFLGIGCPPLAFVPQLTGTTEVVSTPPLVAAE
jgi:hypothetical protein